MGGRERKGGREEGERERGIDGWCGEGERDRWMSVGKEQRSPVTHPADGS